MDKTKQNNTDKILFYIKKERKSVIKVWTNYNNMNLKSITNFERIKVLQQTHNINIIQLKKCLLLYIKVLIYVLQFKI